MAKATRKSNSNDSGSSYKSTRTVKIKSKNSLLPKVESTPSKVKKEIEKLRPTRNVV